MTNATSVDALTTQGRIILE